ncbi:hypothetical protein Ddye_003930 [Dipteronia dyeriana]|uniref:Uncharacterized protein n=1 Tax=Dipteronia dyeriana TaxID=168575 RepID=A0AAD9XT70_9ROSI|nr:hypothetical protein Ddye_003930 [Dipteronia dyeriana]
MSLWFYSTVPATLSALHPWREISHRLQQQHSGFPNQLTVLPSLLPVTEELEDKPKDFFIALSKIMSDERGEV